ncbi:hypothetical protein Tco_0099161 [Tanacetum coccineum]
MPTRPIYRGNKSGRSARFYFSNMEGFYNHLWRIRNPVSEAYMVFCIMQSLHAEYSPYVFKFMETCKEPTLVELYESSKRKTRLVGVMITVQHQPLRKMHLKLHRRREEFAKDKPEASSDLRI